MVQVAAVEIQVQAPAIDVDLNPDTAQRAKAEGGVTQLLANLAGTQGWHLFHSQKRGAELKACRRQCQPLPGLDLREPSA